MIFAATVPLLLILFIRSSSGCGQDVQIQRGLDKEDLQGTVCSRRWRRNSECGPLDRMIECVCTGRSMGEICGYTLIQNMPCYKLERVRHCISKSGWDKNIKDVQGCSEEEIERTYGNVSSPVQSGVVGMLRKVMTKGGCPEQAAGFQDTLSSFLGWVTGAMEGVVAKVALRKDEECKKKKVMYFDVKS